jgi:site-specific recombinase XerD
LRNLSERTIESYWWHINDFHSFIKKDPSDAGVNELRAYFHHMLTCGRYGPGSVKMGYYALKFLFVKVLHLDWAADYLPTPKVPKTLPVVLAREEVSRVLSVISNMKHRVIIMSIYSTGARVSECITMKVRDIDSKRMQVKIQEGKGRKQRYVPLSQALLKALRSYYRSYRPEHYLFEGGAGTKSHIGETAVREILKKARYLTPEIKKHYTPHTFRHCFATHLLEQGVNLLVIQRLMGHADISNTLKYLHVQQYTVDTLVNPLDQIIGEVRS